MEGKIVLITGSTDGIGKATALRLAQAGATVLLHGRSQEKLGRVSEEIKKVTGNDDIHAYRADFSSLEDVRHLIEILQHDLESLDVLINNAGVFMQRRVLTQDSLEMTFQVNYLSHFLLTLSVLDLVKKGRSPRIVNVSSMAHASSIDFENLQGEKAYDPYDAYSISKLCNIFFTYELAERLENYGISVNCLHPGVIDTKLLAAGWGGGMASPVERGADNVFFVAQNPGLDGVTGKYFVDKRPARSSAVSYDVEKRKRLWHMSEHMAGLG